jgi:hypothetical protein
MATINLSLTDTISLSSIAGLSRVVSGQADLSLIETLNLVSTASLSLIFYINANSTVTLSDVARIGTEHSLPIVEAISLTSTASLNIALYINANSTVTLSDSVTITTKLSLIANSTVTLSDVVRLSVTYRLSIVDGISLTSVAGLGTQRVYSLVLTESIGLTSTASLVKQYSLPIVEAISLMSTAGLTVTGKKYITYIKFTQYPTQVYVNIPYTYQAQLFSITEGKPLSGKTVYFSVDGRLVSTAVTDENGLATTSITINTVGRHEVEVKFLGDEIYDYSLAVVDVYAVTPPAKPFPWWMLLLLVFGAVAYEYTKKKREQTQY